MFMIKIAFLCDYYYPFEVSGAEVSSRLLAENLQAKGANILVVTPNFGGLKEEKINGVKIKRFLFFPQKKIKPLPPLFVDSPIWFFYAAFWIWKFLKDEKIGILQVQNKNMVIPASIANFFLKKPLIITVRDYRLLCDLAICLHDGQGKICDEKKYLFSDIPEFIKKYKQPGAWTTTYSYLVGVYELIIRKMNKHFLNRSSKVVCLSLAQQQIYQKAGIKNTVKIFNPINVKSGQVFPREKKLLFVGRYTIGKGKEILDKVIPTFLNKYPNWKFILLTKSTVDLKHERSVKIEVLPYEEFRKLMATVSLCVIPSVWPEPLSRTALDALSLATPIIASNRGSMEEIVVDGKYGYVSDLNPKNFLKAIEKGIKNQQKLSTNIIRDRKLIKKKFFDEPIKSYSELYQSLL